MKDIPPKPGSRTRGWGYSEPRSGAEVDGPHGKLCEARRLGQAGRDGIPEAMCPAVFVCTGRSVCIKLEEGPYLPLQSPQPRGLSRPPPERHASRPEPGCCSFTSRHFSGLRDAEMNVIGLLGRAGPVPPLAWCVAFSKLPYLSGL